MRALHRDIGYFVIGLTMIYVVSGIVLVFRDTSFLKQKTEITKELSPGLDTEKLGQELHLRGFKIEKTEGETVYFKNGSYNQTTGKATYTEEKLPVLFEKLNKLHKSSSKSSTAWLNIIYGVLLGYLAISAFFMFKPKAKLFKRGAILSAVGFAFAVVMIMLQK
jgi:hypothetical protein